MKTWVSEGGKQFFLFPDGKRELIPEDPLENISNPSIVLDHVREKWAESRPHLYLLQRKGTVTCQRCRTAGLVWASMNGFLKNNRIAGPRLFSVEGDLHTCEKKTRITLARPPVRSETKCRVCGDSQVVWYRDPGIVTTNNRDGWRLGDVYGNEHKCKYEIVVTFTGAK